jgi:hypothetical protein
MFLPGRSVEKERAEQRKQLKRIEDLCLELVPPNLSAGLTIDVQEVQCGDPKCSPIDTVITLLYERCVSAYIALLLFVVLSMHCVNMNLLEQSLAQFSIMSCAIRLALVCNVEIHNSAHCAVLLH